MMRRFHFGGDIHIDEIVEAFLGLPRPLWRRWRKLVKLVRYLPLISRCVIILEYCDICGVHQPLCWHDPTDALWLLVSGSEGGVLCPRCFSNKAWDDHGLFILWAPVVSPEKTKAMSTKGPPPFEQVIQHRQLVR